MCCAVVICCLHELLCSCCLVENPLYPPTSSAFLHTNDTTCLAVTICKIVGYLRTDLVDMVGKNMNKFECKCTFFIK